MNTYIILIDVRAHCECAHEKTPPHTHTPTINVIILL